MAVQMMILFAIAILMSTISLFALIFVIVYPVITIVDKINKLFKK